MPIIKSAIKRAKQNTVKRDRNKHYKTMMLTFYKKIKNFVTAGKKDEAAAILGKTFSVIDTAVKKNLIHKNNGARKKSSISRLVGAKKISSKAMAGKAEKTAPKKVVAKKPVAKKTAPKKTTKKAPVKK